MAHKKAKSLRSASIEKITAVKAQDGNVFSAAVASTHKFVKETPIISLVVAEFVGTFLLTVSFLYMQASPLFFAFAAIGATLIAGGVSGAHLNPAITLGAFATRKITLLKTVFYILSQILGAVAAWLVVNAFLQNSTTSASASVTAPTVLHAGTITSGKDWYLFFIELLGTTVIALGIATALGRKRNQLLAAFTVGTSVLIAYYVGLSATSVLLSESGTILTFLNPAIAAVGNSLSWNSMPLAIYIVAPVLGSIIGFAIAGLLNSQAETESCDC